MNVACVLVVYYKLHTKMISLNFHRFASSIGLLLTHIEEYTEVQITFTIACVH